MTVGPMRDDRADLAPTPAGHSPVARRAVQLAAIGAGLVLPALATYGVTYAVGGTAATEDNWVGVLVVLAVSAGLLASLLAFVLGIAAEVRREEWTLLWLPLTVFPAVVSFLVLGELFWWE